MIKTLFFFKYPKLQVATRCWGLELRLWFVLFSFFLSFFLRNLKIREVTNTRERQMRKTADAVTELHLRTARGFAMEAPSHQTSDAGGRHHSGQAQKELVIHVIY